MPLVKPAGYRNLLDNVENTEKAIKLVKDMFQQNLSAQLALLRVTAPMVVLSGTGINDDLNSVERPVSFPIRDMGERRAEVVHSLAKWKRLKLAEMAVAPGRGLRMQIFSCERRAGFVLACRFCFRRYPTHARRSRENCRKVPGSGLGYFQEPDWL